MPALLSNGTNPLLALAPEEPPSPPASYVDMDDMLITARSDRGLVDTLEDGHMRTWTFPDLPNPEILNLLTLFPALIMRRVMPRFPVATGRRRDVEEADDERGEGKEIQFGTGSMWISPDLRSDGWNGTWWSRFVSWWRKVLPCF